MQDHLIVGIHLTDRVHHANEVQQILTEYGCAIRTRLGLHEAGSGDRCSPAGIILIEFVGTKAECDAMSNRLRGVSGVDVRHMVFPHP